MEESFLHFIWKFQLLNSRVLQSDAGQEIVVLQPGNQNTDAGPDFSNAKIKIGDIIWNGNVEIHINSKDWYRHNHQSDDSYNNIVLHIVWKNDVSIERKDKTIIPTLELKNGLNTIQSIYWQEHYNFGVSAKSRVGKLGSSSIDNILINTVAPLLFAYGIYKDKAELKDKAMELLASVKPEINSIMKKWKALEIEINSAFDSQALIELYNEFCKKKRCLNCSIGVDIIKSS